MVFRREYGATGNAGHSGHSDSFPIVAIAGADAVSVAATVVVTAAAEDSIDRRLEGPDQPFISVSLSWSCSKDAAGL